MLSTTNSISFTVTGSTNSTNYASGVHLAPLHLASSLGLASICKILIEEGKADPNIRGSDRETPLHMVANREACLVLLKAGADVTLRCKGNYRPLHLASTMGVAKALIEHGASPNARTHAGSRPLHYVETPGCVDVLVRHKANVNVTNSYGHTPLHLCLSHGNFSVALRLLAHGASLDASCKPHEYRGPRGVSQMTPLQILDATLQVVSNSKLCKWRKREDIEDLRRCKYLLRTWIEVSKHTKSLERVRIQVERELVMGRFCGVVRTLNRRPMHSLTRAMRLPEMFVDMILVQYVGCDGYFRRDSTDSDDESGRKISRRLSTYLPHTDIDVSSGTSSKSSESKHEDDESDGDGSLRSCSIQ